MKNRARRLSLIFHFIYTFGKGRAGSVGLLA